MSKVSIITIVYNNIDAIEDCLKSVKSQTYKNIEHIVIDGNSTDGTQSVIAPYINSLGYYCSEKDTGLYNALNKGIKQCTGDIIGILHSDDLFFNKDSVTDVVNQFDTTKADLVYAHGVYVDKTNTSKIKRHYKAKPFKKWYLKMGWIPLHTTIYVRKELFENFGLYKEDYRIASDYEISLRWFFENTIKISFLDQYVVKMRLGGKSTTAKLQKKKSTEDLNIIQQYPLWGSATLLFKILRKVPQYLLPHFKKTK